MNGGSALTALTGMIFLMWKHASRRSEQNRKYTQTVQKSVDEWLSEANEILTSHFEKESEVEGKEEMERE